MVRRGELRQGKDILPLCECGCGERVTLRKGKPNRFVNYHSWRGKKHSAETKAKISKAHKGKKLTPEHRRQLSKARKARKHHNGYPTKPLLKTDIPEHLWEYIDWDSQTLRQGSRCRKAQICVRCPNCNETRWVNIVNIKRADNFTAFCFPCSRHRKHSGGPAILQCEMCSKCFERPKAWVRKSRAKHIYCSKACAAIGLSLFQLGQKHHNWNGGPVTIKCDWCNTDFERYRSQMNSNNFCSRKCQRAWHSQTLRGENSPGWKGGKSFEPYGLEFNDALKLAIRERDGFACQLCGIPENGRAHDCHHIDYKKTNNHPDNLNALCLNCHPRTNMNRAFWTNLFQAQVKLRQA